MTTIPKKVYGNDMITNFHLDRMHSLANTSTDDADTYESTALDIELPRGTRAELVDFQHPDGTAFSHLHVRPERDTGKMRVSYRPDFGPTGYATINFDNEVDVWMSPQQMRRLAVLIAQALEDNDA